ncbi:hypothetical protein [Streptomyces sp. NEAU-YJ-81]|uniref:hypothetical protein n=1 Tax=Streptomyces sp. NEAU-YJ-81 TaxID=2820288 RepID=UPI001ABC64C3|nr:hypothetical protein [Streptomyces sp. NEAU-YJ-81]MBO3681921.1 hypothetical protein [Streptomyces sp. NEAU-YJ-81]
MRRDHMQVTTDLYLEHHLLPLRDWAHSLGLALRAQPYGLETDAIHSVSLLDIPEGESLGFKNLDDFRCLADGRDMGDGRVLFQRGGRHGGRRVHHHLGRHAAQTGHPVLRGRQPGRDTRLRLRDGARRHLVRLRGLLPVPRRPRLRGGMAAARPRLASCARRGRVPRPDPGRAADRYPRVDVAVLRQKGYAGSGLGAPWFTSDGVPLGWTHTFLSPRSLGLPGAVVRGPAAGAGRPAFKVLVLEGDVMIGRERTLELETARRLVELAEDGLPMIVVGDWSEGMCLDCRGRATAHRCAP